MEQEKARQAFLQDAILCHTDVLCFPEFAGADRISASEIDCCITNFVPPTILTKQKRLLPVRAEYREALLDFCRTHQIALVEWRDNWSFILDEFLDTELPLQVQECDYRMLEQVGISRLQCDQIRMGIMSFMLPYNALLWEWCYLGFTDLIWAAQGILPGTKAAYTGEGLEQFYRWAVEIACMQPKNIEKIPPLGTGK